MVFIQIWGRPAQYHLLEQTLSGEAGHKEYIDKLQTYRKSSYIWIENFIKNYSQWDTSMIKERAKELAKIYYQEILKKDVAQS